MMSSADYVSIDPALPRLGTAFDLPAVSALYEEWWGQPGLRVRARKVHGVEYQPSARCVVTHELVVERGGDEPLETIGVVDVRPAELALRAFYEDPALPWLADAADPEKVDRHLRTLELAPQAPIVRAVPVRYKAGSRCLLRFDLQAGSVPRALYGKVLAMDGYRLSRTLSALRDIGHGPETPRILQPLDYSPDLHMFLLPALAGSVEFHEIAFDPTVASAARLEWMWKAGAVLAGLHAVRVPVGPSRRLADDARDLVRFSTPVASAAPALALPFDEAIGWLAAVTNEEPPPVASHGAFRTDQLLVQGDEPLMIDLDRLCGANPARDVGNFLAYLRWKAIRQPHHSSFIEAAIRSFLEGYGSVRTPPDERWTARYEAGAMLKIAGRRFRNLDVREWALVPRLLEEAHALLVRGERAAAFPEAGTHSLPASARPALDVDAMASGAPELGVPRPLGWLAEISMLVYLPVSGRMLGDVLFDQRAAVYMDLAAACLSALHRSPLALDTAFDVPTELRNLHAWSAIVGDRYPDQARAADRIRRRLSELSPELGAETGRPIHKDFHHQHVFVAERASVIDFDEVCLGDPNFDLGHFCAYLALLGCRVPARVATLARRRDEFLTSYDRRAGWRRDGRLAAFYAYTCLKIAKQLCTAAGVLPRPHGEEEHRQTAAMLQEGLAALDRGF
ncbi:MAG: hypothetical protein E6J83_11945 [Deltaproteobacteria bacterium]|nr:MAG: hypothetical protein E6J83_11945 [Deltaproteobacteria bacterium]